MSDDEKRTKDIQNLINSVPMQPVCSWCHGTHEPDRCSMPPAEKLAITRMRARGYVWDLLDTETKVEAIREAQAHIANTPREQLGFDLTDAPVPEAPPTPASGDFSIGSKVWPGLSKFIEEAGEALQVAGKLMATHGESKHWDGSDLRSRLEEEIADVMAACAFFLQANKLNEDLVAKRMGTKLKTFLDWHKNQTKP